MFSLIAVLAICVVWLGGFFLISFLSGRCKSDRSRDAFGTGVLLLMPLLVFVGGLLVFYFLLQI